MAQILGFGRNEMLENLREATPGPLPPITRSRRGVEAPRQCVHFPCLSFRRCPPSSIEHTWIL